jgi:opacity protein-like surface antigen
MYKTALVLLTVILFGVNTPVYAAQQYDYEPFYIGVGGTYAVAHFGEGLDPDNTWGLNAKLGYRFHDLVALQFDYDYIFGFEDNYNGVFVSDTTYGAKQEYEVDVQTFILSLKGYFPIDPYGIKPFVIVGAGAMHADLDVKTKVFGLSGPGTSVTFKDSEDQTDWCAKLGGGLDWFLTSNLSLGVEGTYVWGFGDLDEIKYINLGVGLTYHFGSTSELARQLRLQPKK